MSASPTVPIIIVSYGSEPWLERSVAAAPASVGVNAYVVLVDKGGPDCAG